MVFFFHSAHVLHLQCVVEDWVMVKNTSLLWNSYTFWFGEPYKRMTLSRQCTHCRGSQSVKHSSHTSVLQGKCCQNVFEWLDVVTYRRDSLSSQSFPLEPKQAFEILTVQMLTSHLYICITSTTADFKWLQTLCHHSV